MESRFPFGNLKLFLDLGFWKYGLNVHAWKLEMYIFRIHNIARSPRFEGCLKHWIVDRAAIYVVGNFDFQI